MCEEDGMEEWKECKLGEFANIIMGQSPESSYYNNNREGIPFLQGNRTFGFKYPTFDTYTTFITKEANKDDVIMSVRAPVGDLNIAPERLCLGRGVCSLRAINGEQLFLYYLMKANKKQLLNKENGTVFGSVNRNDISNLNIHLPPLPTQQKIAAILSSLDDKIELNNKINTSLEQQAQTLFKNWFVDFEPFSGKMPEGWKVGKLSEYCTFQEGYVNPAQTHNEYFDGDVKWLRAVDINESFILNTSRTLTKCGFESAGKSAFLFKPGSIAISKSGTVGRLGIISDFMCGNRAVIGIELKDQQNLSYIHQYLKSRQTEFPDMAVGSVQKNLYVSILENLDIIIPSKEVLEKYAKICMPFYDQIKTNCVENNNLSSIRDTLLPKLMNGEIETIK